MIMQGPEGGDRRRSRAPNHPWNHPQLRLAATPTTVETRCHKVTMTVTKSEYHAIRSRAGRLTVSDFLRINFPAELLLPKPDPEKM